MAGLFSTSAEILGHDLVDRVQGAIDAGDDYISGNTWWKWVDDHYEQNVGGEPTDIPEDFLISYDEGTTIRVPHDAAYLIVAAIDGYYGDNLDPDGDYKVRISPVPEPGTMLLLGSGLIGLAAFRRKFTKR